MVDIPLVALQGQTAPVNGAANFIAGAQAKSDLDSAKLQQAQASIGMMGSVALGAMGGNINAPAADPTKWQQGVSMLKAHGIDMSQYGPDFAPTLARASVGTLGQLQQATNQRDFELQLAKFKNDLMVQNRPQPTAMGTIMTNPNTGQPLPGSSPMGLGYATPSADGSAPAQPASVTLGPDGRPDPATQAAFLGTLDPQIANLVRAAGDYQLDPSKIASLKGNQRMAFDALVQQYNPLYDSTRYPARAAYLKSLTSGTYSQTLNSANLVINHLGQLLGNAKALDNGDYPMLNSIGNTFKSATGKPEVTNFDVTAKAAGDELAKVFKGTGATDVGSIEAWQGNLDHNASPAQQQGAITTAIGLLKSRLDILKDQYQENMGTPATYVQFLKPDTVDTLKKLGYDPNTLEKVGDSSGAAGANLDTLKSKYGLN